MERYEQELINTENGEIVKIVLETPSSNPPTPPAPPSPPAPTPPTPAPPSPPAPTPPTPAPPAPSPPSDGNGDGDDDDDDDNVDPPIEPPVVDENFEPIFESLNLDDYEVIRIPKANNAVSVQSAFDQAEVNRRQGKITALLLERGGEYIMGWAHKQWGWMKGSAELPAIFGAYGEGVLPTLRPGPDTRKIMSIVGNTNMKHWLIDSIRMRPNEGEEFQDICIRIVQSPQNSMIERCDIQWWKDGLVLDNGGMYGGNYADHFDFNGNTLCRNGNSSPIDGSGPDAHRKRSQGLFIGGVRGFRARFNRIGYNGWTTWHDPIRQQLPSSVKDDRRANASIYSHGFYIQYNCDDRPDLGLAMEITDNIFFKNGSHGLQLRCGGVVKRNVFWGNGIAAFSGSPEAVSTKGDKKCRAIIEENLVCEGEVINEKLGRNHGLQLHSVDMPSTLSYNIFANMENVSQNLGLQWLAHKSNGNGTTTIEGNVIHASSSMIRIEAEPKGPEAIVRNNRYDPRNAGGNMISGPVPYVSGSTSTIRRLGQSGLTGFSFSNNTTITWDPPKLEEIYPELEAALFGGVTPESAQKMYDRYMDSLN